MHLCTCVSEGGDGEGAGSEALSLLSYTLKDISLADVGIIYMPGGGLRSAISAVIHT